MPRAPAQKLLHFAFSVFSAHYVHECCGSTGFQKSRGDYLITKHTNTHFLRSRVALRLLKQGGCLDLTTISLHIFDFGALHQRIYRFLLSFETRWHRLDGCQVFEGWETLLAVFFPFPFFPFFAHNDLVLDSPILSCG